MVPSSSPVTCARSAARSAPAGGASGDGLCVVCACVARALMNNMRKHALMRALQTRVRILAPGNGSYFMRRASEQEIDSVYSCGAGDVAGRGNGCKAYADALAIMR